MGIDRTDHQTVDQSAARVLDVLGDPNSRQILGAVAREPKTVPELVDELDVSRATAYRKIDELTTAGLIDGQPRFRQQSRVRTEYVACLGEISVSFDTDGPTRELSLEGQSALVTDGGHPDGSSDTDQQRLGELFREVTGTDQVVEQQSHEQRQVAEGTDGGVATDAAEAGQNDGLDDTLPKPDGHGSE